MNVIERCIGWGRQHKTAAKQSGQRLLQEPIGSLLTLAVIALGLALPMGLWHGAQTLNQGLAQWQHLKHITVYVSNTAAHSEVKHIETKLKQQLQVASFTWHAPQEALEQMQSDPQTQQALALLDDNPFPGWFEITPNTLVAADIEPLLAMLANLPNVLDVTWDRVWLERWQAFLNLLTRLAWLLMGVLVLGIGFLLNNVLRMELIRRKAEIQVADQVGATRAFLRRPIMYTGVWLGLFGALLACLLLWGAAFLLKDVWQHFAARNPMFETSSFALHWVLWSLPAGALLGGVAGIGAFAYQVKR